MKKLIFFISIIITLTSFSTFSFAESVDNSGPMDLQVENSKTNDDIIENIENEDSKEENDDEGKENLSDASEEIIESVTKKDKRIAELKVKYNNDTLAVIAYYLEVVRFYSTPIFFIFFTIGAFNFFIIGNKKLDKKEQGFGWITACIIGWVVFQCIPLIFALLTI